MRRIARYFAIVLAVIIVAVLVIPMVWPVPPLEGTVDPGELAYPDSSFVDIEGVEIHYRESGSAQAPMTVILMHGFGASTFSWRDQMPLLGDRARVIAFDRPAFGLTERPLPGTWSGPSPYGLEGNVDQVIGLMDHLGVSEAVLVGHSAGGALAVAVAADHPGRVSGLVLEAPAVREARALPSVVSALLRSPQARRVGPLFARRIAGRAGDDFVRGAYHFPEAVTPTVLEGYRLPLRARDWDRGLWELITAPRVTPVADRLSDVTAPALIIAGEDDTYVPLENSRWVYETLRDSPARDKMQATLREPTFVSLPDTGHLPHEERPDSFGNEVFRFLDMIEGDPGG